MSNSPAPRDGFLLKNGTFVEDPLFLFLLTQIGYRAAELQINPMPMEAQRYIGWAWHQRKREIREIANKLKADAVRVADNESEDEVSVPDPNESEEHRAKRKRIEGEDHQTRKARNELEEQRRVARRERLTRMGLLR